MKKLYFAALISLIIANAQTYTITRGHTATEVQSTSANRTFDYAIQFHQDTKFPYEKKLISNIKTEKLRDFWKAVNKRFNIITSGHFYKKNLDPLYKFDAYGMFIDSIKYALQKASKSNWFQKY